MNTSVELTHLPSYHKGYLEGVQQCLKLLSDNVEPLVKLPGQVEMSHVLDALSVAMVEMRIKVMNQQTMIEKQERVAPGLNGPEAGSGDAAGSIE